MLHLRKDNQAVVRRQQRQLGFSQRDRLEARSFMSSGLGYAWNISGGDGSKMALGNRTILGILKGFSNAIKKNLMRQASIVSEDALLPPN